MISEGFVQNGANVYISSRDAKACAQACSELNALSKGKASYITADFYKEEDIKKLVDELRQREGSKLSRPAQPALRPLLASAQLIGLQSYMSSLTTPAPTGASPTTHIHRLPGTVSLPLTSSASSSSRRL